VKIILAFIFAVALTSRADEPDQTQPAIADSKTYLAEISSLLTRAWPSNRTVNIVCHGHSVPSGYFRTPKVDTFKAYPHLLHRGLKEKFPFAVINVIVTGIGGEQSEQGAKRFECDVLSHRPDLITIDYALNDRAIGLKRAEAAWRSMITNALARGIKIILLTPTPDMTAKLDDPNDLLNQHAEQIRHLAAEFHVGLADSLKAFKAKLKEGVPLKSLMAQSNHPNRAGHELVAAELLRWFPSGSKPMNAAARKLGVVKISADSAEIQNEADNAIDGDPKTIWHTPWRDEPTDYPHYLQIEIDSTRRLRGFTALPRQDGNNNGWICDYAFYASDDGKTWGTPVARGSFDRTKDLKTVLFNRTVSGRFFQLVALSSFAGPYASLAEFSVLETSEGFKKPFLRTNEETTVTIDGKSDGLVFDGVGAVSSGGSTRLLIDYPSKERGEILDYLFKPNYGAGLQILKVEIGADTDATCGAEPSHERARGKIECNLGYEWWLMKEAQARNPKIKLCGLAWGAPGWLKDGFWSEDNIQYTLAWLDCAKQNGLRIDYLGGGNERGWDADYYIKLRKALNEHGYSKIKIVATDDHNPPDYWDVAEEMQTNRAFADAVDILGQHDICVWRTQQRHCYVSPEARALGKPLWDSENSTQDYAVGHEPLARAMTRHYIDGRIIGNLNWALVGAYYGTFPAAGTGLLLADQPWSGWYSVGRSIWVDAHMTQFAKPGWRYLDSACGYTPGGAGYVTLRSATGDNYSTVIETLDATAPENLVINVTGDLSRGKVNVWRTNLRSERDADYFVKVQTIKPENGRFRFTIEPGCIYTLSTTTQARKGNASSKADRGERLSLPFHENFENIGAHRLAPYFSDVHGGFETVPCGGGRRGMAYRQMVSREPILWHGAKMPPTTIVGDPLWWGDYEVSVDALLEESGYVELLGRVESQQHNVAGYHFQVSDGGAWKLYTQDGKGTNRTLAAGADAPFEINAWHRLALRFQGSQIVASLDGNKLADVRDESHSVGQTGFRVSAWQHAQFDNFRVEKTARWPEFIPHAEMSIRASSAETENIFGALHLAQCAIDDRVETSWRSRYAPPVSLPQSLTIDLQRSRKICGLTCRPESAGTETGVILTCKIYISADGKNFEKVADVNWEPTIATRMVSWSERRVRYVRLEVDRIDGDSRFAGIAEIQIIRR
jgi:lysophospholipase L1-like esterase